MQGMLTEGQPARRKVNRRSLGLTKSWRKFTISPVDARKVDWCWRKVLQLRRLFMENVDVERWLLTEGHADAWKVNGWSLGHTESWRKSMECAAGMRKVDRRSHRRTESWRNLRKCPADMRKVNGRSRRCTESRWMVLWLHGNLTEVDKRSRCRTKSWQNLPWTHESWSSWKVPLLHVKLMEVDRRCCGCTKVDGGLRKVPQPHRKLMEGLADARKVDGRSRGCTESWRKLMEGTTDAQKVDGWTLGCT